MINIARKIYKFTATIIQNQNMDAGYIEVPFDVEKEFGKKRVLVEATFDDTIQVTIKERNKNND